MLNRVFVLICRHLYVIQQLISFILRDMYASLCCFSRLLCLLLVDFMLFAGIYRSEGLLISFVNTLIKGYFRHIKRVISRKAGLFEGKYIYFRHLARHISRVRGLFEGI